MFEAYQHHYREYIYNSGRPDFYFGYTNNMAVRRELLDPEAPFAERSRGADTILVHQLASRLSCDIVRYCPEMRPEDVHICARSKTVQAYSPCSTTGVDEVVGHLWPHMQSVRTVAVSVGDVACSSGPRPGLFADGETQRHGAPGLAA
jgi:hypothetical protein